MLHIKWSKAETGELELHYLSAGDLFKTRNGHTVYMLMHIPDNIENLRFNHCQSTYFAAINLESGQLHLFERDKAVVQLEGYLEVKKMGV